MQIGQKHIVGVSQSNRGRRAVMLASAIVAAMAWTTTSAYAYLDPGSVSFVLQGVVGGIAAVTTVIGAYWAKIKGVFSVRDRAGSPDRGNDGHN